MSPLAPPHQTRQPSNLFTLSRRSVPSRADPRRPMQPLRPAPLHAVAVTPCHPCANPLTHSRHGRDKVGLLEALGKFEGACDALLLLEAGRQPLGGTQPQMVAARALRRELALFAAPVVDAE